MDALKFLKERNRMCHFFVMCKDCPLKEIPCGIISSSPSDVDYEKVIAIVEQWSASHPRKTRQSVFLEQWPNASVNEDGVLFCPKTVNTAYFCRYKDKKCGDCRREFWMQEVE